VAGLPVNNNDEYGWLIVPMLMAAVVVVTMIGGLLLDRLPPDTVPRSSGVVIFVGGTILATVLAVAIIMAVAITWLGCCD
jgi:hypothetical protein